MPLYSGHCEICGHKERYVQHINHRDESPYHCGQRLKRIIEAPTIKADLPGYQSPIDGKWIEGKAARREDLKKHNCREWEGLEAEKKAAQQRAEESFQRFDKGIEKQLYQTFNNMSLEKQRTLTGEEK